MAFVQLSGPWQIAEGASVHDHRLTRDTVDDISGDFIRQSDAVPFATKRETVL